MVCTPLSGSSALLYDFSTSLPAVIASQWKDPIYTKVVCGSSGSASQHHGWSLTRGLINFTTSPKCLTRDLPLTSPC